jgi:nitroimidazol reductase NimA-like FMN-containing flavoprotein (pyridoxamine 5'-phosphate oxidase superfamily)
MQARMKQHQLSKEQIANLISTEQVGHLASVRPDGYPYITPVHYIFADGCIYVHGLAAGEKLENIKVNKLVCFEIENMFGLLHDANPCDTNTHYESVIIRGHASMVASSETKISVLNAIVDKYAPQHSGKTFPDPMLKMTAVIKIEIKDCVGKYFDTN